MEQGRKEGQRERRGTGVMSHCQRLQQEQQEVNQTVAAIPYCHLRNEVLGAKALQGSFSTAVSCSSVALRALLAEEGQDLVHILWGWTATTAPVSSG